MRGRSTTSRSPRRYAEVRGLAVRPRADEMDALAEGWRPYRAVAARILWHHYLSVRAERRAAKAR